MSETDEQFLDSMEQWVIGSLVFKREHRERLFALARRGAAVQWRPFSEAPESRDEILVYRPDAGVFMALHCEEDAYTATPDSPPEGDFYWFSTCGEDLTVDLPTHWMPLPPPPEKDTQS